jgi:two-component system C4-dicarboxylate transport response regulator DctD
VRELKAAADRFALGLDVTGRSLEAILGSRPISFRSTAASLADRLAAYERHIIESELKLHNGSIAAVMDSLQVPRRTLNEKMARLGVRQ